MVKISNEREGFRLRLQHSLRNSHYSSESPTELARDFNMRFEGRAVTVHAARKWLVGEAIPTQDKMRALADWLGVSVEWLRFGGDERQQEPGKLHQGIKSEEARLIADLRLLDGQGQQIIREIIRLLLRSSRGSS